MSDNRNLLSLYGKSPLYQLFVSLLIVLGAGIILFSGFLLAGMLIFGTDTGVLEFSTFEAGAKDISFLRYVIITQDISLFIVPAVIIMALMNPDNQIRLTGAKVPLIKEIVFVIVLAFCLFPITSFTGQLNSVMHLPDWLSGVEQWMTEKEDYANHLTGMLTATDTFRILLLNLFVVGVMPAIGEELIFRGVFQKIFYSLFRSGHVAVWVTAFIFSAIHFQFFGFAPRLILGLVFGYLFLWSGTLWLPVISHFVNNAVPVIVEYIQGPEKINAPPEIDLWKQMTVLPLPVLVSLVILIYFRNKYKKGQLYI